MSKQILVTGGTGFLGAHLLFDLVKQGHKVRALRRASSPMELVNPFAKQIEWVDGDILDVGSLAEAMSGVQQVYHCAGMVSFMPQDKYKLLKVNVEGTANVVNIALDEGVEKLVHVSSIAALGRKSPDGNSVQHTAMTIDETTEWEQSKLNSNYAISKFKGECEVWRGIAEGLNAVIVNPSVIMGNGFWDEGSAKLVQRVDSGLKYYTNGITGFVDVRDVSAAMIQLMASDISNERYILNAENWSYKDVFTKLALFLGKTPPQREASAFAANMAWRLEKVRSMLTGARPLLTEETVRTAQHKFNYDNTKLLKALPGFTFTPVEATFKRACEHYLIAKAAKLSYSTPTN